MPVYDYECECGKQFEDIKPISECNEPSKCPKCGKMAKRIFVPQNCHGKFTFILKGWGWSNDGYDGVSKDKWRQKNVFNKDGTLKSREGDKNDWGNTEKFFDQKPAKKRKKKSGRKRMKEFKH